MSREALNKMLQLDEGQGQRQAGCPYRGSLALTWVAVEFTK